MTEKQKQNEQGAKRKLENQTLTPEQEKQLQKEKEQVILLSKIQRGTLSNEAVENYLSKYHNINLSKYSPEIQKKFIEEMQMLFGEFKNFDTSMITRLRTIREGMSWGMESGKSDEYYRNMIIGNALQTRITLLQSTIETQYGETIDFKGTKVNKSDFENYKSNIKNLDTQNGLNIFDVITSKLRPSITGGLNFKTLNIQEIFKDACIESKQSYSEELYQEYYKYHQTFASKYIVYRARNGNGVIKYQGKGFGLQNGGVTGLDNDRLKEDIYKDKMQDINIENMGMADLVILIRILTPVISDYDSFKQTQAGVNFDGSMQKTREKILGFSSPVLGVLSILGVGYGVKLAINSPKYKKAIATIGMIIDKFSSSPEMLKDVVKNEKVMKMLEAMKGVDEKIPKLLEGVKKPKQTKTVAENTNTNIVPKTQKLQRLQRLEQTKDSPYYNSHFSTEIPASLKHQNPLAWIDKSGEIHYNQIFIENKFGVKITTENGKTLFDGKSLKEYNKENPSKFDEILELLKELKSHEVTHRILEARGIRQIKVGEKIYSQEDICSIVDGSKKVSKEELVGIEKALQEKFGADFRLFKNGEIDADAMRRYDTKQVAKGGDFSRESEAARSDYHGTDLLKISLGDQITRIASDGSYRVVEFSGWREMNGQKGFLFKENGQTFWNEMRKFYAGPPKSRGAPDTNIIQQRRLIESYKTEFSQINLRISQINNEINRLSPYGNVQNWQEVRNSGGGISRYPILNDNQKRHDILNQELNTLTERLGRLRMTISSEEIKLSEMINPSNNRGYIPSSYNNRGFYGEPVVGKTLKASTVPEAIKIQRNQEVLAVGDLHGNIDALWGNLHSLGVIDTHRNWKGGNRKLVFQGDILADRNTQGIEILKEIDRLKLQAKNAGGDITIIAGNHDDYAISMLIGKKLAGGMNSITGSEGLSEFYRFGNGSKDWKIILSNMRKTPEGRKILENICNMKLVEQIDDTLFVHTDITENMGKLILNYGVDNINKIYQDGLRRVLLKGEKYENVSHSFGYITDIFLNTENRKYMSHQMGASLKQRGINHVIHGHSNNGGKVENIGGILVSSIDNSYGRTGQQLTQPSTGIIRQDGNIQVGGGKISINGGYNGEYVAPKINTITPSINSKKTQGIKGTDVGLGMIGAGGGLGAGVIGYNLSKDNRK